VRGACESLSVVEGRDEESSGWGDEEERKEGGRAGHLNLSVETRSHSTHCH